MKLHLLAFAGVFILNGAQVVAQDTDGEVQAEAPVQVDESMDAEARALFEAGQIAYDAGRFEDALLSLQQAYERSARPALLYNIGMAADRARNDQVAIEAFERFVELQPEHPMIPRVEGRLRTLRSQQRTESNESDEPLVDETSTAPQETPPAPQEPPSRTGQWALGIAGGALAIGGTVLLAVALGTKSDIESQTAPAWADISSDVDGVPVQSGVGIALMVAGGVAAIGAVLWRVLTPENDAVTVGFGADRVLVEGQF